MPTDDQTRETGTQATGNRREDSPDRSQSEQRPIADSGRKASTLPPSVKRAFIVQVLLLNVGLLALALGAMLVYFRENPPAGGILLTIGIITLGSVAYRYRTRPRIR
ncbi:MAG: hypothetical protein ABEJ27_03360 [Halodesulfurarchaeum sp.]